MGAMRRCLPFVALLAVSSALQTTGYQTSNPTPPRIKNTQNYRDAKALSDKLAAAASLGEHAPQKVAVLGGGLSGLACAKYLADAGPYCLALFPSRPSSRGCLGGAATSADAPASPTIFLQWATGEQQNTVLPRSRPHPDGARGARRARRKGACVRRSVDLSVVSA